MPHALPSSPGIGFRDSRKTSGLQRGLHAFHPCGFAPADVDIVTEIEAKCFPPAERASRERFVERLNAFSDCFLILMKDDRPVGLIDGMVTDNRTICDEMFADAKMHNPDGHWQ